MTDTSRPAVPVPPDERLPAGFPVELDEDVHRSRDGRLLLGGNPPRLLRLSGAAARILDAGRFTAADPTSSALARRLLDVGVVHPRPAQVPVADVTVVVPVRDRAEMLDRLLAALRADPDTAAVPVIVVDDASADPGRVCAVAARHGGTVLRHDQNWGAGAARNTGLHAATTRFVAFCDSDVVPEPGWLVPLLAQFGDPAVALAAPRVVSLDRGDTGPLARYEEVRSPLDLGDREAPIVPLSAVAYVPGAAMVVRVAAVCDGFAPDLRVGEDVDLCLRLYAAGWRLRYVPQVRVAHEQRTAIGPWLWQRVSYGSSAAQLALRHPGQVPPLNARPWTVAACLLLATGRLRPALAAVALTAVAAGRLARRMPDADTPVRAGASLALAGLRGTAWQLAHALTRHHWPIAVAAALASRRARYLLLAAGVIDGLVDHRRSGVQLDPVTYLLVRRLDDVAYGAGLWLGAARAGTVAPLLPRVPVRSARPGSGAAGRMSRVRPPTGGLAERTGPARRQTGT